MCRDSNQVHTCLYTFKCMDVYCNFYRVFSPDRAIDDPSASFRAIDPVSAN